MKSGKFSLEEITKKFRSRDSREIWEATWEILRSNDKTKLRRVLPYVSEFEEILKTVNMGGAFRRNSDDTKRALKYIEDISMGLCRCSLYSNDCIEVLNPETEEKYGHVTILNSEVRTEDYERRFCVCCSECGKGFKVREVHGWHVPWYEWKIDSIG